MTGKNFYTIRIHKGSFFFTYFYAFIMASFLVLHSNDNGSDADDNVGYLNRRVGGDYMLPGSAMN